MIKVTKLNGEALVINCLLIETVEATPDTVVTLTTGHKIMVRESVDDLLRDTTAYHRSIGFRPVVPVAGELPDEEEEE